MRNAMGTAFSAPAAGRFSTPVRGLRVLDSAGKIIIPGLVDLRAHTYPHSSVFGIPPDKPIQTHGSATTVSEDDAVANNFAALRRPAAHYLVPLALACLVVPVLPTPRPGSTGTPQVNAAPPPRPGMAQSPGMPSYPPQGYPQQPGYPPQGYPQQPMIQKPALPAAAR